MTNNPLKAAELLRLPSEVAFMDGRITSRIERTIVQKRVHDFTKPPVNGKRYTDTWEIEEKQVPFTHYALNQIAAITRGLDYLSGKFTRETSIKDGNWFGWQEVTLSNDDDRLKIRMISQVGKNVATVQEKTPSGQLIQVAKPTDMSNPPVFVKRLQYTKTSTGTRQAGGATYPIVYLDEVLGGMNVNEFELAEMTAQEWIGYSSSSIYAKTNELFSAGCEVIQDGNKLDLRPYYNGLPAEEFSPSGKITSYNKQWPGIAKRWRLYNGESNSIAYGSTWMKQYALSESDVIELSFGALTTYEDGKLVIDRSQPATLWATFEELPAQGKGYGAEAIYEVMEGENGTPVLIRIY